MRISDWSSDVCSSDLRGVERNAVAIELVMEVRAGRKAGRADIADNFPLLHTVATVGGDPAHMGIARHQAALMLDADLLAIAAGPPRANAASIGGCEERRAVEIG